MAGKLGVGFGGGWSVHAGWAVGPRSLSKLVDVARARTLSFPRWVRCSWRVLEVAPDRRTEMVMVLSSLAQGRRNSRWSLRTSGWFFAFREGSVFRWVAATSWRIAAMCPP